MLSAYDPSGYFDEMSPQTGSVRKPYETFAQRFQQITPEDFDDRRRAVDTAFLRQDRKSVV